MEDRILLMRVGLVVIVAALLLMILAVLVAGVPFIELFSDRYTVYINFQRSPGVSIDTPVRRDGVLIGRVRKVRLLEGEGVQLAVSIDGDRELNTGQICRLNSNFPLGNAVLEFVSADLGPGFKILPLQDGDVVEGVVGADPLQSLANMQGDLTAAMRSISAAANEATALIRNANNILDNNADQMRRVMQKSEGAIDEFRTAMSSVNEFISDEQLQADLKGALRDVPELVKETRQAMQKANQTLDSFSNVGKSAERNLANLESFTMALGEQGPALMDDLKSSTSGIESMIGEFREFGEALNSSEGTLGRLVHDPDLYLRLNRAALNIEDASRQLRPILDNVNVITDKIARDPGGSIGVKSILDRSPSGLKFGFGGGSRPTAILPGKSMDHRH